MKIIHGQLNNLTITDPDAQLLEQLFQESIALLEDFENPGFDLFALQKRNILKGLKSELVLYQHGYRDQAGKAEKINGFIQARGQLHFLLSRAMKTCQQTSDNRLKRKLSLMLNF